MENFSDVYNNIDSNSDIGVIINYPKDLSDTKEQKKILFKTKKLLNNDLTVGFIGAGGFTENHILPILKKTNFNLIGISSLSGFSALRLAKSLSLNMALQIIKS